MYIHVCICVHMYVYDFMCVYMYICACEYMYICIPVGFACLVIVELDGECIKAHTYMYPHTRSYKHACMTFNVFKCSSSSSPSSPIGGSRCQICQAAERREAERRGGS